MSCASDHGHEADDSTRECSCCYAPTTGVLCEHCRPETCLDCPASHVYYDETDAQWKCSHGCAYTTVEYVSKKLFTVVLNAPPAETLSYAGKRVEVIIPNGTPVTPHRTYPDTIDDGHILTTHFTPDADAVMADGLQYPPHEHARDAPDRFNGTIREDALYAWPYTPAYIAEHLSWASHDLIFLEVAADDVAVSSYRFLNIATESDTPYTIPLEKYESALTFTPMDLQTACETYNRPCRPTDLLLTL